MKRCLSIFLVTALLMCSCFYVPELTLRGSAANVNDLTFTLNEDGASYCVSGCDSSITGSLEIPSTYNGLPVTAVGEYAFVGCASLTDVVIPEGVKAIGFGAFGTCEALESVTIPDTVIFIDEYAFCECYALKSIDIPDNLTELSPYTFYNCTALASVTVSDNLLSIGEYAFGNCEAIKSFIIPNKTTEIGESAFYGCFALESISIPESVTSIADSVFSNCSSLKSVTLPDTITSIGEDVFSDCTSLLTVDIPSTVTTIGSYAFEGCEALNNITIPSGVISIGDKAFYNCTSLTVLTISDSVDSIGIDTFYGTGYYNNESNWENDVLYIGSYLVKAKNTISGNYKIKDNTKSVTAGAFYGCKLLEEVVIPSTVRSIDNAAFSECTSLSALTIPEGVKSIGDNAFRRCVSLKNLNIPTTVLHIGNYAFSGCDLLESVTVPDGLVSIGVSAFDGCTALTNVNITSLSSWCNINFGSSASNPLFYAKKINLNGTYLTELTVPNGVKKISSYAFYNCDGLTKITIPNSVEVIGDYAFYNCSAVKEVSFSENVTEVGASAFSDCKSIVSVRIPDSVLYIGDKCFLNCTSLTTVSFGNSLKTVGYDAFGNCAALATVNTSNIASWCNIDFDSFSANPLYYAKKLYLNGELISNLVIPNGVKSIGDYAFYYNTAITSVTVPQSLTSIGYDAFTSCTSLARVNLTDVAAWCNITFASANANPLYCAKNLYLNGEAVTALVIPEGVTNINSYAFYYCTSLTDVTFPTTLKNVGNYAFYYCYLIKYVFYSGTETEWNNISFGKNNTSLTNNSIHFGTTKHSHSTVYTESTYEGMQGSIKDVCSICGHVKASEKLFYANDYFCGREGGFVETDEQNNVLILDVNACKDIEKAIYARDGYYVVAAPNTDQGFIGTNSYVNIYDKNWNFVKRYYICVQGDVNGDSVCDVLDCMLIELVKSNDATISGLYFTAADLAADGKIDGNDYTAVVNHAMSF